MGRPGVEEEISGAIELLISISNTKASKHNSNMPWQPNFMKKLGSSPAKKEQPQQTQVFGITHLLCHSCLC